MNHAPFLVRGKTSRIHARPAAGLLPVRADPGTAVPGIRPHRRHDLRGTQGSARRGDEQGAAVAAEGHGPPSLPRRRRFESGRPVPGLVHRLHLPRVHEAQGRRLPAAELRPVVPVHAGIGAARTRPHHQPGAVPTAHADGRKHAARDPAHPVSVQRVPQALSAVHGRPAGKPLAGPVSVQAKRPRPRGVRPGLPRACPGHLRRKSRGHVRHGLTEPARGRLDGPGDRSRRNRLPHQPRQRTGPKGKGNRGNLAGQTAGLNRPAMGIVPGGSPK